MQNQRTSTMSTPNPLMPQGALQRPSSTMRSRTVTAISVIVTLHVVVIVGVLMGCNRDKSVDYSAMSSPETLPKNEDQYHSEAFPPLTGDSASEASDRGDNAAVAAKARPVKNPIVAGPPPDSSPRANGGTAGPRKLDLPGSPMASDSVVPAVSTPPPSTALPSPTATLPPDTISTTRYAIRRGDTFSSIASRNGVTLDALLRANPTSDPKRLQIGQSINIPASSARPPAAAPPTAAAAARSTGGGRALSTYEVQPGDNLTAIAGKHRTTVADLKAANNLRSDRIRIGDKLKIPAR